MDDLHVLRVGEHEAGGTKGEEERREETTREERREESTREERREENELLIVSVLLNNKETVIKLLNRGADPDSTNEAGFGLLQLAPSHKMVTILLYYGASFNMRYKCGYTALIYHIKSTSVEADSILELLIQRSNNNIADKNGFTPLHHVIMKNRVSLVRKLMEYGADPSLPNEHSGESPLHLAARRGSRQIMEILLTARVPVSPIKKTGESPLHLAAWSRDLACAFLLMRNGVNVGARSKSGSTALHWAAERGDKDMIILLLVGGSDPLQRDHFGLSSVMVADKRCGEEVSSVFDKYTKHTVHSLAYLARQAYLWKGPMTCLTHGHVTHQSSIAYLPYLPLPIRDYLRATDYQLMRENLM